MRPLLTLLMVATALLAIDVFTEADCRTLGLADIDVLVTSSGLPLENAAVSLDLNGNGIWEPHLGEPQAFTTIDGIAVFNDIVSIHEPGSGTGHPCDVIEWQPSRILTGSLRSVPGSSDAQFDFVMPPAAGTASLGLFDLRGRCLVRTDGVGNLALNVPNSLSSGLYFVRLSAGSLAPVAHRIIRTGARSQTILAHEVSVTDGIASGWLEPKKKAVKHKDWVDRLDVNIFVSHVEHGMVNTAVTIEVGMNAFFVDMPVSPDGFVYIAPGTFMRGSPEDEPGRWSDELKHQVVLTQGFYMSKHEITEQMWSEVMGGDPTLSQLPKGRVSWDLAVQFCNALSVQESLDPAYVIHATGGNVTWNQGVNGYRLPTEAEWEYACRAMTTLAYHNNTNCLSSDSEANFRGDATGQQAMGCPMGVYRGVSVQVGSFPANAWGLFDMHGNAWEWVWDWYGTYPSGLAINPTGPGSGTRRVLRGGAWNYYASSCRSAYRGSIDPTAMLNNYGFRLVRSVF